MEIKRYNENMKTIESKTDTMKLTETKLGGELEEILRYLYVDKNMPVHDMCKVLGTSYVTTLKWLKLAGVYSRKIKVEST